MIIQDLKLSGFRNLKNQHVSFCKDKNLIYGLNGTGKTSILEAIFLSGFGKSFLSVKKSDIVTDGSKQFNLHLRVANANDREQVRENIIIAHYTKDNGIFSLLLNDKKSNIFEISGYLYPLIFSSSNYNQYIESKTYIRKLVDRFVFGINALYINYLLSYNKALKQKNHLLKARPDGDEIRSWNNILSEMSEKIVGAKMKFIDRVNDEINNKFGGDLRLNYEPAVGGTLPIPEISQAFFFSQLEKLKQSEILQKRSLMGPHLDHFEIRLNRKNLKFYSSGEKKINLLMIYIAFIELFKKQKNEYPVFLVDDFDTAIDVENINFLIKNYPDLQVIATSVNKNNGFNRLIELRKEN